MTTRIERRIFGRGIPGVELINATVDLPFIIGSICVADQTFQTSIVGPTGRVDVLSVGEQARYRWLFGLYSVLVRRVEFTDP